MRSLIVFLLLGYVDSFKFLAFSTQMGRSHVNFLARISDILVDAGHEVVIVSPVMNSGVGGALTDKARVIEIPQCEEAVAFEKFQSDERDRNDWSNDNPLQMFMDSKKYEKMFDVWGYVCKSTIEHPGLIEVLKAERFDAAFGESFDMCGPVLFHLLGIDKWAFTDSVAIRDGAFFISHTPTNPAYVPCMIKGTSDVMTFWERFSNSVNYFIMYFMMDMPIIAMENILRQSRPDLTDLKEIASTNSLVFLNSEPLVDFPKITSARVIDIGGIISTNSRVPMNKTWSDILDLRPQTVLISFGTMAKSFLMPEEYKHTILETFRRFPNVTFIWKYEKPEHKISNGVDNLIEATWIPQQDLLHDSRLTAFITHCGQGSTTEALDSGIPLIVIPVIADQVRNSYQIERNGNGIRLEKSDLEHVGKLEGAIREILTNESYRDNARKIQTMIAERPFPMKEVFVRNMEFLAKHGPLRQLDHYGRHLNFFQYYLIDVFAAIVITVMILLSIITLVVRMIVRIIVKPKAKRD